jgi:hypothetical protein
MSDLEVIQALFDTKPISLAMNWPVDVENFVGAVKELRALHSDPDSDPHEIAQQWRRATGALGMEGIGSLLTERGEWQSLVYPTAADRLAYREHDDYVVLWEQPAGCVLAKVKMTGDMVDSVEFRVTPVV